MRTCSAVRIEASTSSMASTKARARCASARLENFRPAGIAVERLRAEAAHELDLLGADVERRERNALGA